VLDAGIVRIKGGSGAGLHRHSVAASRPGNEESGLAVAIDEPSSSGEARPLSLLPASNRLEDQQQALESTTPVTSPSAGTAVPLAPPLTSPSASSPLEAIRGFLHHDATSAASSASVRAEGEEGGQTLVDAVVPLGYDE
jgi:hypothetical protein